MEEIIKVLNYQPLEVSEDELRNPLRMINSFFVNYPLHESRAKIWELYKGWVHLASELPDGAESKDMLVFYGQLVEMLSLCYVLTKLEAKKD